MIVRGFSDSAFSFKLRGPRSRKACASRTEHVCGLGSTEDALRVFALGFKASPWQKIKTQKQTKQQNEGFIDRLLPKTLAASSILQVCYFSLIGPPPTLRRTCMSVVDFRRFLTVSLARRCSAALLPSDTRSVG